MGDRRAGGGDDPGGDDGPRAAQRRHAGPHVRSHAAGERAVALGRSRLSAGACAAARRRTAASREGSERRSGRLPYPPGVVVHEPPRVVPGKRAKVEAVRAPLAFRRPHRSNVGPAPSWGGRTDVRRAVRRQLRRGRCTRHDPRPLPFPSPMPSAPHSAAGPTRSTTSPDAASDKRATAPEQRAQVRQLALRRRLGQQVVEVEVAEDRPDVAVLVEGPLVERAIPAQLEVVAVGV
jgi:hypothetical protein